MALAGTGDVLGDACKAAVDGVSDPTDRTEVFRALGNAIIDHIISNGTSAVTVVSVSGVTVGAGVSGPGTGNLV